MKPIQLLLLGVLLLGANVAFADADEPRLPPQYVNINTADAETLAQTLQGIGAARAEAIVEYREANGGFETAEDLLAVQGVGQRTLEINAERIRTED